MVPLLIKPAEMNLSPVAIRSNMFLTLAAGGVALIYKSSVKVRIVSSTNKKDFSTFEYMDCNVLIKDYSLRLAVLYRPPPTNEIGLKTSVFLEQEWSMFFTKYTTIDTTSIIVGDSKYSH